MSDTAKHKRTGKGWALRLLFLLCLLVFLGSVGKVLQVRLRGARAQAQIDQLVPIGARDGQSAPSDGETVLPRFAALLEQNSDLRGWLTIPDTDISYPIMFAEEDGEYYLHRAFDKTDTFSGTPFLDQNCGPDSDCVIIYAHNMKNGTMFGTLDRYLRFEYFHEHPTVWFDSLYEEREYEVFAAVQTRVYGTGAPGFHYYESAGALTDTEFALLVDWLQTKSVWDSGIVPVPGDQILILSTCSYHTDDGRFLIAARRSAER